MNERKERKHMGIDRIVPAFAGLMILVSLLLGLYVNPDLRKLGVQPGAAF